MDPHQLWRNLRKAQDAWEEFANRARDLVCEGHRITGRGNGVHQWPCDVEIVGRMVKVTIEEDAQGGCPYWARSSIDDFQVVDTVTFPLAWLEMPEDEWKGELRVIHTAHAEIARREAEAALSEALERKRQKKIEGAVKILKKENPELLKEIP